MKKLFILFAFIAFITNCAEAENMKNKSSIYAEIEIEINGEKAEGVIYDNSAGRSFAKLLPVTINMADYNNTEKIGKITGIDTSGMASSYDPDISDIAYYEPFGNLCFFYRDFGLSYSLYSIGRLTGGIEHFAKQKNDFTITIKEK